MGNRTGIRGLAGAAFAAVLAASGCGENAEIVRFPPPKPNVSVGSQIFDFTLSDAEGHSLSPASFKGRSLLVLVFDRGVWNDGCRKRLRALGAAAPELRAAGAEIAAITSDPPAEAKTYFDKAGLPFPLLSDPDAHVIRLFGLVHEGGRNGYDAARPALFILDREGIVRYADVPGDDAAKSFGTDLAAQARELSR